jgi:thiamine-phosphate pyrophosphorylase
LPQATLLYLISDRVALGPDGADRLVDLVADASRAGVDLVQIRERDLPAADAVRLTARAVDAAGGRARVLVNDRFDVALAAGAAGVHLTTRSLAPEIVRRCVGRRLLIGVSTHAASEARQAADHGADFVVCGPVFDTPSKRAFGPPIGIDELRLASEITSVPVLALGGIDADGARRALAAGAAGVAGIRVFHDAWLAGGFAALEATVRALREQYHEDRTHHRGL